MPQWSKTLPQLPRLVHHVLAERHDAKHGTQDAAIKLLLLEQKRTNRLLQALLMFGVAVGVGAQTRQSLMTPSKPSLIGEMLAEFLGTLVLIALFFAINWFSRS